ncbi:4-carboxymuconolactone decarboxylase [Amycolatopsis sp. K13G38]|uniref:4-carboxymuconolactone decarboxylase n=1 Tax=Amycolatopsis acididurans TaxID=2724524 RepID=A0ABX1J2Y3_9PSEU|nr:4-carboxymuconolactone decarboxylase [Amycolatopsis acididurans]NKQ54138.1 4-carboxymuconolactone decarboxylase [Amycolatopsis acididurans]
MNDEVYEEGMKVRREVLGDAHVDRAIANTTAFTAKFQDYITRAAWGSVWTREGLDRKTRSCVTLAVLTALGRENEIAMHVRAAIRNGLTPDEIGEVLLHTGVYAGVPASNAAFAIAQKTLSEMGEAGPAASPPPPSTDAQSRD